MLDSRLRKHLDFPLLALTLGVAVLGIVTIYSVTRDHPGRFYAKQTVWLVLGLACIAGAASLDYSRLARLARPLYAANLAMLLAVFRLAEETKGSQRWIDLGPLQFQPSEFAKLTMILCLAAWLVPRQEKISEFPTLLGSFAYMAVPMLLIFKQPDLGTSLVLAAIWFGMAYMAGARARHLAVFLAAGVMLFAGMWHFNVLKSYQKNRLAAFVSPEADPRGVGYQVLQSRIAVGSGQVWGKGFGRGSQSHGRFIPENHTDFIFTVVGEEGGFVLSASLIALYAGILARGARTIALAEDAFGRLMASGIVSMYAFHIIVNLGMTLGIMPVTGVPLPLFSYGGSNLLLNLTAIGLLLGIGMRRHRLTF